MLAACSSHARNLANYSGDEGSIEFEVGMCLRCENLNTMSLVPEIYEVKSYTDGVYVLTKYQPHSAKLLFASDVNYENLDLQWDKIAELKMTFKYVHFNLIRMACPNTLN